MYDRIEKIDNSWIQHGKLNDRIYLMNLDQKDMHTIVPRLNDLAEKNGYSKIFVKVPIWATFDFSREGYIKEAFIPDFYPRGSGAYFMAKYPNPERAQQKEDELEKICSIIDLAKSKADSNKKSLPTGLKLAPIKENNIDQLAALYSLVFKSYPFPIFDTRYLRETMESHIDYYGVFKEEKLISASSAEKDTDKQNAEMTDFATHPDFSGKSLALFLLRLMELEMKNQKMRTLYTIARAFSPSMNITFARNGYEFGGTLVNNTNIFGGLESMNVWYKRLR